MSGADEEGPLQAQMYVLSKSTDALRKAEHHKSYALSFHKANYRAIQHIRVKQQLYLNNTTQCCSQELHSLPAGRGEASEAERSSGSGTGTGGATMRRRRQPAVPAETAGAALQGGGGGSERRLVGRQRQRGAEEPKFLGLGVFLSGLAVLSSLAVASQCWGA